MRVMAMAGCNVAVIVLLYLQLTVAVLGFARQRLFDDLFKGYHKEVFPPVKEGPLNVELQLSLIRIAEVNKQLGYIDLYVYMKNAWQDSRLSWDPKEYSNTTQMHVPPRHIWRPDITLYNNAGTTSGIIQGDDYRVIIYPDGNVLWVPPARFKIFCDFAEGKTQKCMAKFGSWIYNRVTMNVTQATESVDMSEYAPQPNIGNVETSWVRYVHIYECCPDQPYVSISYSIQFTMSSATHMGPSYGLVIALLVALMNCS